MITCSNYVSKHRITLNLIQKQMPVYHHQPVLHRKNCVAKQNKTKIFFLIKKVENRYTITLTVTLLKKKTKIMVNVNKVRLSDA